ncbi:PREDICTED: lactation elevated protein 1-like, partial [Amphimedon queenslandica]|uniref:AAA+ ATPase domain-containing protein n=1 Tax=Amphimedon queenslandica TaxID=400682 RepID=A0AAN0JN73_AMPQE
MAFSWRRVQVLFNGVVRYSSSLSAEYQRLVGTGKLNYDEEQFTIVEKLEQIRHQLMNEPNVSTSPNLFNKFFNRSKTSQNRRIIKGAYMHGSVGSGKTMLMDLFFNSVTSSVAKQRYHFNEFMLSVHSRIHSFKQLLPKSSSGGSGRLYDPIGHVASDIATNVRLLCFDEFQVTDITDAMILKSLFTSLFNNGVTVVATSNRHPEGMYVAQTFFLNSLSLLLVISRTKLKFLGRELLIDQSCADLAYFHFDELCNRPLSAADYIEICKAFNTIFIQDIPCITNQMRTQGRRFITLIDTLYDHKVCELTIYCVTLSLSP